MNQTFPKNDGQKEALSYEQLVKGFADPPMKYAPYEFWFWDQDLNTLGIKPQDMARELYEKGFNPGYAHARENYAQNFLGGGDGVFPFPPSQWLSDKWFAELLKTAKQASRDGSHFSFADEYGWPSLQAGGKILENYPDMTGKSLDYTCIDVARGEPVSLPAAFFTVAAKIVHKIPSSYVSFEGEGIQTMRTFADQSKPSETATLPYNMGAKYLVSPENSAVFHPFFAESGAYEVYARWPAGNGHTRAGIYEVQIPDTAPIQITVNQQENSNRWNLLGVFQFPAGSGSHVRVLGGAEGKVCVDALRFERPGGMGENAIIIDELHTTSREIGILSSKTRALIGTENTPFVWTAPDDGTYRVYSFHLVVVPGYDGSPVNYLDRSLGQKYTELVYRPFAEALGGFMGMGLPVNGSFSDHEGAYGYKLAWSEDLAHCYQKASGRDLRADLPLLIDRDEEGFDFKARYDWYEVVSDIYTENFRSPIEFTKSRGMYYTMHTWEESLQLQAATMGDYFKLTRTLTLPGTDCLMDVAYNPANFMETVSIAEFEGVRCMAEMMALDPLEKYTPRELKRQANYLSAWGISHFITHAVKMTRPYAQAAVTPDFYNIDPAWRYLKHWTDYVRRISYVNASSEAYVDVLLVNPMDSIWACSEGDVADLRYDTTAIKGSLPANNAAFGSKASLINECYTELIRLLTRNHIGHQIADKTYIREMVCEKGTLIRGNARFHAVLLPPMTIIDNHVAQKLLLFVKGGGFVYFLGELPAGSIQMGRKDDGVRRIIEELMGYKTFRPLADPERELACGLPGLIPAARVTNGKNLLVSRRKTDKQTLYWIANNEEEEQSFNLCLTGASGGLTLLNPEDGSLRRIPAVKREDGLEAALTLAPCEGIYLACDPTEEPQAPEQPAAKRVVAELRDGWTVRIDTGSKAGTIVHEFPPIHSDRVRFVCRKGAFENPEYVEISGLYQNNGEEVSRMPSVRVSSGEIHEAFLDKSSGVSWKNEIPIRHGAPAWIELCWPCEQTIERLTVITPSENAIRSYRLEYWDKVWWKNLATYNEAYEPELIQPISYPQTLLGAGIPAVLGDFHALGVLDQHFAGFLDYQTDFELKTSLGSARLDLGRVGQTAEVFLNETPLGARIFPPFTFDLTGHLREGRNTLRVRIGNAISQNSEKPGSNESGLFGPVCVYTNEY